MVEQMIPLDQLQRFEPEIVVLKDYDEYFERLVRGWVADKTTPFRSKIIKITSGPYRPDAVTTRLDKDGTLHLDFYSVIRNGFGGLSTADVEAIKEQWL